MTKRRRPSPVKARTSSSILRSITWPQWLFLFTGIIVGTAVWYLYPSSPHLKIDYTDQRAVDTGRREYMRACASCHGANLEGQPNWRERLPNGRLPAPPHDATGHTWHHTDIVLFQIIKNGPAAYPRDYPTDMPAFGGSLSDDEIASVIAFIKSTWPPDILRRQLQVNSQSR